MLLKQQPQTIKSKKKAKKTNIGGRHAIAIKPVGDGYVGRCVWVVYSRVAQNPKQGKALMSTVSENYTEN